MVISVLVNFSELFKLPFSSFSLSFCSKFSYSIDFFSDLENIDANLLGLIEFKFMIVSMFCLLSSQNVYLPVTWIRMSGKFGKNLELKVFYFNLQLQTAWQNSRKLTWATCMVYSATNYIPYLFYTKFLIQIEFTHYTLHCSSFWCSFIIEINLKIVP